MAYTQAICIYIGSACLLKTLLSYGIYTGTYIYIYRECLFVKKVALLWHIHRQYVYI